MATTRWKGGAGSVPQVTTVTLTAYDVATTYKLTVGSKVISVAGQGGTVITTATALVAAWAASTAGEVAGISADNAGGTSATITLTADTPGVPFTVTSSVTGGTGTIGAATTTQAATGPHHWDNAANWSGGAVPASGDTVFFDRSDYPVQYGLAQSAVTLAALYVSADYAQDIGLAEVNTEGSTSHVEYRPTYLAISASVLEVGQGEAGGQGSGASRSTRGPTPRR